MSAAAAAAGMPNSEIDSIVRLYINMWDRRNFKKKALEGGENGNAAYLFYGVENDSEKKRDAKVLYFLVLQGFLKTGPTTYPSLSFSDFHRALLKNLGLTEYEVAPIQGYVLGKTRRSAAPPTDPVNNYFRKVAPENLAMARVAYPNLNDREARLFVASGKFKQNKTVRNRYPGTSVRNFVESGRKKLGMEEADLRAMYGKIKKTGGGGGTRRKSRRLYGFVIY